MNFSDFSSSTPIKLVYLNLYKMAAAILDEKLHYFSQKQFSVNIYQLAAAYDIQIYVMDMAANNFPSSDFVIELFGYLNTYAGKAIYLNQNTGNLTRRYTIAYHLAYYLLNDSSTKNYVHYFTQAAFPMDLSEQLCHLLASFLLMPVESVNNLMVLYKENAFSSQLNFSSWISYLGNTMGLPAYYTAASLESIRTLHVFLAEDHAGFS